MNTALSAHHLACALEGGFRLEVDSLECAAGQWTAVVGPNGAGKSTLLKALAGLLPASGTVHVHGQNLMNMTSSERAKIRTWVGQSEHADGALTVRELVGMGRSPHLGFLGISNHQDRIACEGALNMMDLVSLQRRRLDTLSGGERQRALLARAVATQAACLLLDEPLNNLDPQHQVHFVEQMHTLTQAGVTPVTVLHELNIALRADSLVVMQSGRVIAQGPPSDVQVQTALKAVCEQRIELVEHATGWIWAPR